jgi:predicted dehydrogenase
MYPVKTMRVGIVGLGIGRWHIESYLAMPEVKVAAICDADKDKLKSIITRYGIIRAYTNYEELCQSDDVDAISICVPNYLHAPIAIYALEHGKHILCEKPLSNSPADAEKILETSRKFPDLKAMVAMKFRFNRDAIYIKNMVESGEMGNAYYGFASYLKPLSITTGKDNWRIIKSLSGGGTLIDNGLHLFDLIWWIMGCPKPVEAFGNIYTRSNPDGLPIPQPSDTTCVEDLASGMVKFDTGATIMFESAWKSLIHDGTMTMRIFGTNGSATLWPFRIIYDDGRQITSRTIDHTGIATENQFKHFIQCIENKRQPISTIEQGVTVLKIMDAIYRSAREKKAVVVDQINF